MALLHDHNEELLFQIGEFSTVSQVSIRMLRYYDEAGLFHPKIIDERTGYRYYSASQLPMIQKIALLRDLQFNVTDIAAFLQLQAPIKMKSILTTKKVELIEQISDLTNKVEQLETICNELDKEGVLTKSPILFKSIPSYQIVSLRRTVPNYQDENQLWLLLNQFVKRNAIDIPTYCNNNITFHHTVDEREGIDIEVCYHVINIKKDEHPFRFRKTKPIDRVASMIVYGSYTELNCAFQVMIEWLSLQQYHLTGPSRLICHYGGLDTHDSSYFITEIQLPVTKSFSS